MSKGGKNGKKRPESFETIEEYHTSIEGIETTNKKLEKGRDFIVSKGEDGTSLHDPPKVTETKKNSSAEKEVTKVEVTVRQEN